MLNDQTQSNKKQTEFGHAWYALYTRYHHERSVARALAAKGFSIFLPLYSAPRRWKDRNKVVAVPLFSCYVFIQGSLKRHLDVVTTPGVYDFIRCSGAPAIIPPQEIEGIRQVVERSIKIEPHPFIRCGDRVRVKAGPLEGIEGILIRKKNFNRLILTVELLGKSAAVEVDVSTVERINAAGRAYTPAAPTEPHFASLHAQ